MKFNFFEIYISGCCEPNKNGNLEIEDKESDLKKIYANFDEFFNQFSIQICAMEMKHADKNSVFSLCQELIEKSTNVIKDIAEKMYGVHDEDNTIQIANAYMVDKLKSYSTRYRRDQIFESSPYYVVPQEIGIGARWDTDSKKIIEN